MRQNDEPSEAANEVVSDSVSDPVSDPVSDETQPQTALAAQTPESLTEVTEFVPSSDDPMGTRIIYVIVAMVVLMFIIALFFLFEVARRRPA